jgi:hypothetical protein
LRNAQAAGSSIVLAERAAAAEAPLATVQMCKPAARFSYTQKQEGGVAAFISLPCALCIGHCERTGGNPQKTEGLSGFAAGSENAETS